MKLSKGTSITLTPEMLNLMQHVPFNEVEIALRNAFPKYFTGQASAIETKKKTALEIIRNLPKTDPNPEFDVMAAIREMRDEEHLDF